MKHVLAFYAFVTIDNPEEEVERQREFLSARDSRGRIYISEEGINGQMSASEEASYQYQEWMHADPRFKDVEFKVHLFEEHAFDRLTIKRREQLVALDQKVDLAMGGEHVPAEKWAEMIAQKDDDTILIDVRNDYEWEVGHFEGALLPEFETFREFPNYAQQLATQYDPEKTKVMMYCTGGIRCEVYSALMKEKGFKQVFQLDGGVIKYGLEKGKDHWRGKLFVFDDRLVVPISEDNDETISECRFCGTKTDSYFNCAHMDCNELFIACLACAEAHSGCCCTECAGSKRVRPFEAKERAKPYRRLSKAEKETLENRS
jgi:UPF0176 protein